jgi:lysozyme
MVLHPYKCSMGRLTIGVGHNLDCKPISRRAAEVILEDDIRDATAEVDQYLPWAASLDTARRASLINLCFNLGINGLLKFVKFLKALELGDYTGASFELRDSLYAKQVPDRAWRVSEQIRTGEWQ